MKKTLSILLAMLLLLTIACAESATTVFVSISDDAGQLVLAYKPVDVSDLDDDGMLTICDALMGAHMAYHPEGAAAYYAEDTEWGKSLYVLWGVDNGGSYGYMLNDVSPTSLLDPIRDGDHIKAYAYSDLTSFGDTYCYFAAPVEDAKVDTEVALTLTAAGYDVNWSPITLPVTGAVITVNGEETEIVTDENGNAVLDLAEAGTYTISAVSDTQILVPPVCILTVGE